MEIRRYQPEDFGGLLGLVQACYGKRAEPPEWWKWRHFEHNPEATTIWLACDGSRIVGMRPMSSFDYSLGGTPLRGALFSAVMVHPEWRRRGVFTRLVKEASLDAWKKGCAFATTMPNDKSYLAFKKLGWTDPGDRVLMMRVQLPLTHLIYKRPVMRDERSATVGEVFSCFPADVGIFTQRLASNFPGLILRRDQGWLNWRYRRQPWNQYRRFIARDSSGNPVGLAVTNRHKRKGLEIGYIVDLLSEAPSYSSRLIHESVDSLERDGVRVILAIVSPGVLSDALAREGFRCLPAWGSPKKFHTVYQVNPDFSLPEPIKRINNWYQTLGDWDGI